MIHITHHKNGLKMAGFVSINTGISVNPYCQKSIKNKYSICSQCYGYHMEKTYKNMRNNLNENFEALKVQLSDNEIKEVVKSLIETNRHYIRFHSLGELHNTNNLINFFNIAQAMPNNIFGLWTKRSDIVKQHGFNAPKNLSMIYSNPKIDHPLKWIKSPFNGIFNVVTYDYCIENNIVPNCTGKCISCLKCYRPGKKVVVTELIKSDQTKIKKGQLKPLEVIIK